MAGRLVVLADDLTGATDAGIGVAKRGLRTEVWLDLARYAPAERREAFVFDTESRNMEPARARERIRYAVSALGLAPEDRLAKKIDSTLRGPIGAEIAELLALFPQRLALVVPAYPKNGRTTRDGMQFVHDECIGRIADHLAPLRTAEIALDDVRAAPETLVAAVEMAFACGAQAIVVDAERDEDLAAIARLERPLPHLLWVGSAGIFEALDVPRARAPRPRPAIDGPVLFTIGSMNETTHRQIEAFRAAGGVAEFIDPLELFDEQRRLERRAKVARVQDEILAGRHALLALAPAPAQAAIPLQTAFMRAVRPIIDAGGIGAYVASGGDTAFSLCLELRVPALELLAELAPGVPLARAVEREIYIVTKAGGFGTPRTYLDIIRALTGENVP